jgi:fructan beta-fructosidase
MKRFAILLSIPASLSALAAEDGGAKQLEVGSSLVFPKPDDAGRSYVRTFRGDFAQASFRAEVTATLKGCGGAGCAFFGMGCGQINASSCHDPSMVPSLFVRLAPGDFCGGAITVTVNGSETQCGQAPAGDGRHRLRLTWDAAGKRALFETDANWDGQSFKPDTVATLRASSVDFGEAGHLFVGGACGVRFDAFAHQALTAAELQAAGFGKIFANDPPEPLYQEDLRPQFHFTARYWGDGYNLEPGADLAVTGRGGKEGWMNDVNGPIYFDGEYHLFAQRWWHCWLHAVSKDLVHWEELKPAFGQDDRFGGTQSGSCVIDYHNVSGLATGSTPVMIAFWSATDNQRQCISFSNDRGRSWTKYDKNPVLVHPYRDPKVFWHEPSRKWVMVLCGPPDFHYYILTSANLLQWEEQSKIPDMYECPDMFPLPLDGDASKTKWVIINGDGKYLVGDFDGCEFKPLTDKKRCEWGENFYAAQSWHNMPQNDPRRIQIAWMAWGKYPKMPFNQQLSFPCELTLHTNADGPALHRYPIREIERLWAENIDLGAISLQPGDDPLAKLTGKYYDIDLEIDLNGSDASEIALELAGSKVRYLVKEKIVENCGARAELAPVANRVALRILLDRTSIEVFGNHGIASLTKCMLPDDSKPPLSIRAVGGKALLTRLTLHKLKSMWREPANAAEAVTPLPGSAPSVPKVATPPALSDSFEKAYARVENNPLVAGNQLVW